MDDIKPEDKLMEKIKDCQKTARNLKEEWESLLQQQKSTDVTADSDHSVKQTPLVDDVTSHLMDIAIESIQQQLKLVLEKYLSTQSDLSASIDRPMIQSDANQTEDVKVAINQEVKLSDGNKGQIEGKPNPTVQALSNGTLHEELYLRIISFMGIQECLLSNRLVCSLWNKLVLEWCRNQKSLKLFDNFDCLMKYGELLLNYEKTDDTSLILKSIGDDLVFEALETDHKQLFRSLNPEVILNREKKKETSKVLTKFFPRVQELVLCTEFDTLINVEHLLQFYAEQLTSLTVTYFGGVHGNSASKLRAFNFPKLKMLNTFDFSPASFLKEEQLLSLLPQLESLTMESTKISLETLLCTGTQLRELNIEQIHSVYTAPETEFSKRPRINTKIRKFTFPYSENALQTLEFISRNLTSLQCLNLELFVDPNKLHLLTSYLVPLQQLHSLTLRARVAFFFLDDNQLAEIQPLPSVRHLKLTWLSFDSLSIDLISRALFTAFPKVQQILITFDPNYGRVDAAGLAAFEAFAHKHPNIVQRFRSKTMSRFTNYPNAVAPLLGHHRQMYEEYIEEEELFGLAICKLTAYLVVQQGDDGFNLKSALRPADRLTDRLTAMSNLCQLLESKVFAFTYEMVITMIKRMVQCSLEYGPSQVALFIVTCKCVLSLLDCRLVDEDDKEKPFLYTIDGEVYPFVKMMLKLVEHSKSQQLEDKSVLLQLCKRIVDFLTKFDSFNDAPYGEFDEYKIFTIFLKLAYHYKTQKLTVLDNGEKLLLQINNLIDDQLMQFDSEKGLITVIIKLLRSKNRVYQVEMARSLTRCCGSTESIGAIDNESNGSTANDDSSSESEFSL